MELILDGKSAKALDRVLKSISLSGEVSICARSTGVLFQSMCPDRSAISEIFVRPELFQEYKSAEALQFSVGAIDFYRGEMESLALSASDALVKIAWKKKDVEERRIIYTSPSRLREIDMKILARVVVSPGAIVAALRTMKGVDDVLLIVEEDEIVIRSTSSSGFSCDVRFEVESAVRRSISVSKTILKKTLASATSHDRVVLELGEEEDPIRFVFESLEWNASVTIATIAL